MSYIRLRIWLDTGGPSFTKRLVLFLSKSAAGGWCLPWANAGEKKKRKESWQQKIQQLSKQDREFLYFQLGAFFRNQNCSRVYIGYFCKHTTTPNTINIDPLNWRAVCRMGSLAWLGYLSYTQVVESSNLSPSIICCSASFLAIHHHHLAETPQNIVPTIQDMNRELLDY